MKELGYGMNGTTYLVGKYAKKIQHILPKERNKDFKYNMWREIDFFKAVDKLKPADKKYFITLHSYEIYDDCDHKQKHDYKILDPKFKKIFDQKDASPWCLSMTMKYIQGDTLHNILSKTKVSEKQLLTYMKQILTISKIFMKMGYAHGDFHPGNIMVTPTGQLVAIDYGSVLHKKFNLKITREQIRDFLNDRDIYYFIEASVVLIDCILNVPKLIDICKKNGVKVPGERNNGLTIAYAKIFKNHPEFYPLIREKYAQKFPSAIHDMDKIVKSPMNIKTIAKRGDIFTWSIVYRVDIEFAYFYPNEYREYYQWCNKVEPLLGFDKTQKILLANTFEELCDTIS